MKRQHVILSAILAVSCFGILPPQLAQNSGLSSAKPDLERRFHAVSLLRAINTAQVGELSNYGSYASWPDLLAHQPKYFGKFLAMNYPRETNLSFADMPQILPGWSLRFQLHSDGRGYDVRLQDLTDKQSAYIALTDESCVIWEGSALH